MYPNKKCLLEKRYVKPKIFEGYYYIKKYNNWLKHCSNLYNLNQFYFHVENEENIRTNIVLSDFFFVKYCNTFLKLFRK